MKYQVELSGRDINLLEVAVRMRLEGTEDKHWQKVWLDLLVRIAKKQKAIKLQTNKGTNHGKS